MADKYMELVLTPAVQQAQDKYYGGHHVVENAPENDALTPREVSFIALRNSFYQLAHDPLRSRVERLFLNQVISYDWNCSQYITPRFTPLELQFKDAHR